MKEWTLTVAIRDDASPNVAGQDRSGRPEDVAIGRIAEFAALSLLPLPGFETPRQISRPIYVLYPRPLRPERVPAFVPRRSGGDAGMRSGIFVIDRPNRPRRA
jgi:hypothetical protein